ncbi:ATP-dependent protease ClpP, protease subunit [Pilibacter termitis]|uniref:ATP-dependent Clp protease proteolytic subunit n=1 Tax=Pilibacter termitis TaxID=263852 RepID=A0A1T4PEJ0_9ENTE|nr:head maturation protease, ClpP-related [Pilibacter termitis]SJZ89656.1 ATP-dependent protease ClpP, protease subunit [Pilibacter termitis]
MKKVKVSGMIVSNNDCSIYRDWFGMDVCSPKDVESALNGETGEIEVQINSNGGDLYAGSEIYTLLKEYTGKVVVKITGIAASAASLVAMAGDEIKISPSANMMIHNVSTHAYGDHQDFSKMAEVLKGGSDGIAGVYASVTGKTIEEIQELMDEETYMNATQALENGFVTEILYQPMPMVAGVQTMLLSKEHLQHFRTYLKEREESAIEKFKAEQKNKEVGVQNKHFLF